MCGETSQYRTEVINVHSKTMCTRINAGSTGPPAVDWCFSCGKITLTIEGLKALFCVDE